jgi:hypothetical protein
MTRNVSYGLVHGGDSIQDIPGVSDSREPGNGSPLITDTYYKTVRWRSDMVAYFMSLIDSLKDENGNSLLNSSLAVWAHTTGNANHDMLGHSLISVGSANGKIETGLHVDAGGAPVNRFHITNMKALGLTQSDIEKSGRAGFGEYSAQTFSAGSNLQNTEPENKDFPSNSPDSRVYTTTRKDFFFQDVEKRKAFPYLKT